MSPRELFISSKDGVELEAVVFQHKAHTHQHHTLLFVHQYSLLGGNMSLMMGMGRRLHALGYNCVVFNCRGVGRSLGTATLTGRKEVQDVLSVVEWIHRHLKQNIIVIGSSAGAPIAGSTVRERPYIHGFIAIGYTFGRLCSILFGSHYKAILTCDKPKLFIMGSKDGFTSERQLRNRISHAHGSKNSIEIISNVGHFELEDRYFDEHISVLIHNFIGTL